jgi:hypothetical protein
MADENDEDPDPTTSQKAVGPLFEQHCNNLKLRDSLHTKKVLGDN